MALIRKLKPDRNVAGPLIPVSMILVFGIASWVFDLPTGLLVTSILVLAYSLFYLLAFARTRNYAQLILFADVVFAGYILLTLRRYFNEDILDNLEFALAYFSGLVFFGFVLGYLLLTRKLKWRGREVFELAGGPVEEIGDGYTSRPRPVGKVEYSPEQVRRFARFCAQNLIALPYATSQNTTLVPIKMGEEFGRLLGLSGDYRDATWVNFAADGEVSVHIAQKDYLDYRYPLAFDALCTSLGQLFVDFFELFNKGEGVRVIDRMDDLRLPVFS
jgi:hypothetical protein